MVGSFGVAIRRGDGHGQAKSARLKAICIPASAREHRLLHPGGFPLSKETTMTTIAQVMTRNVEVVGPDETLQRAAQMMGELNVGSLPVCSGRQLLGIITDRDITVRATAAGLVPSEACVSDVMSDSVQCCAEGDSTDSVMQTMGDTQIRRVPVLNDDQELVGIVSLGDLATRQGGHIDTAVREISMPSQSGR
jgi:CBS domain-containing protein